MLAPLTSEPMLTILLPVMCSALLLSTVKHIDMPKYHSARGRLQAHASDATSGGVSLYYVLIARSLERGNRSPRAHFCAANFGGQ